MAGKIGTAGRRW